MVVTQEEAGRGRGDLDNEMVTGKEDTVQINTERLGLECKKRELHI